MTPVDRIRHALDRRRPPAAPPRVYEPTARLVYTDLGLPRLFAHAAAGLSARLVHVEELADAVATALADAGLAAVSVAPGPLLQKVRLADALVALGLSVADPAPGRALLAGCDAAVAETGSLVYRTGLPPGWSAAAARVVVVEPRNLVPDLIDLLVAAPGDLTLVAGPADVRVFVLH